jgi:ribonuclease D
VITAKEIPEQQWPRLPKWQRSTPQQDALIDISMAYLKQLAYENEISPGILCNRKDMEKLVMGERDLPILQGWRKQLVGQPVLDLLEGRYTLLIKDNKITVSPVD